MTFDKWSINVLLLLIFLCSGIVARLRFLSKRVVKNCFMLLTGCSNRTGLNMSAACLSSGGPTKNKMGALESRNAAAIDREGDGGTTWMSSLELVGCDTESGSMEGVEAGLCPKVGHFSLTIIIVMMTG